MGQRVLGLDLSRRAVRRLPRRRRTPPRRCQWIHHDGRPRRPPHGRYVAFQSWVADLVPDDVNGKQDVFVWDRISGLLTRVTAGNRDSDAPQISGDGRFVAFQSGATDLVPGDVNGKLDVFLWDRLAGSITRVSAGNRRSWSPSISDDGRYVAYDSSATDIEPPDRNEGSDVFIWDRLTALTTRVTRGDRESGHPLISGDGRYVVFVSQAADLVPGDKPGTWDVFAWDRGEPRQPSRRQCPS
jgi:Tol biopolymer transport system component